jgi:bacterial/archaeal transporter family-2 protein
MIWVLFVIVFVAGGLIATQAGINAELARALGSPVLAATVSFVVGTVALGACALWIYRQWPDKATVAGTPWWAWTGGLLGAVFVVITAALAKRLGAGTLISTAIAGQVLFALALDHFGLAGFTVRPVGFWRIVGASLLIAGTVLVRKC